MTDQTTADGGRQHVEEAAKPAGRWRPGCWVGFLVGVVAAVVFTLVAVGFWRPAREPGPLPPSPPVESVAPQMAPQPTIILATTALPATAEQLQQEAEVVALRLRDEYPDLPEALHVVAMLYSQISETEKAETIWRRCIELDPKHVGHYVNLAAIAMDRGKSELAVDALRQALDAGCSSPDLYHHLGVALTQLGRCEEAEGVIQQGLAAFPQSAAYWLVLGQAQLKLGKSAEAEASLRKAIDGGVRTAAAYFALANACARQGKQAEAAEYRRLFKELKAAAPLDVQQRFQILTTAEARRTAVAILCEAATVHFWQQNSLEAERLYLRSVALDPSSPIGCRALATLYHSAGMFAEEHVVRRRLVEIDPYDFDNYLNLAKVCAQLGESASAEAALKLAISMQPHAAVAYATLAQFYLQEGKAKLARWFAQEAVRREPSADGYRFLAATCRVLGDEETAQAAEAEARKLDPGGRRK